MGLVSAEVKTLSQRPFLDNPEDYTYTRGTYLIVLASSTLESLLSMETGGNFIEFKQSQGFTVEVIAYPDVADNRDELRDYFEGYSDSHPDLEYVLFVGDVNGTYAIPPYTIPSYNEIENDVTDYPYSYYTDDEMYNPRFLVGRWSISNPSELLNIKSRTIQYSRMENIEDRSYLNKALLVAGNYKTADGAEVEAQYWPVTPRWTSMWIQDKLESSSANTADTIFFYAENQVVNNPEIANIWNDGVGLINYRGWGDSNGWHKPYFHREEVEELTNTDKLPIVFSFVCNNGDFGNDYSGTGNAKCFGEKLITAGSLTSPKGAAAMVGPSDLDTDTRFNNVLCGKIWDELIEGRISELAPLLHAGKQSVSAEFNGLEVNSVNGGTMSIPKFYHHIYSVLGDPSISIWLGEPNELSSSLESNTEIMESFVSLVVSDENGSPLQDVVGALLDSNGDLIAKGLSNQNGELNIEFNDVSYGSEVELYLNAPQFMQKRFDLTIVTDNGSEIPLDNYAYSPEYIEYTEYSVISSVDDSEKAPVYNWIEINQMGTNLNLTDDSQIHEIEIGFDFNYFGESYNSLSICSNGWVSFIPTTINHFWNFSIPFPMGPDAMIAPFMDDLDDNGGTEPLNVYAYQDVSNNQFIVQWDNIANGEDDEYCGTEQDCTRETFQLILRDPSIYQTETGDGEIIFQYKDIQDIDENGNYSTIGIESPDQNFGYQYQFRNITYGTQLVENEMAILFTTNSNETFLSIDESILPSQLSLFQNFPNPFNPTTTISFNLDYSVVVNMSIFDLNGTIVYQVINNQFYPAGKHSININAGELPSGLYFYQLQSGNDIQTKKMLLLK